MTDWAIEVDHLWKKFRRGEIHDSLRELIPALGRRLLGRGPRRDQLERREFWALRDVSFAVERGQSLGIIGPNGAGKSTMLKVLSRIIKPNRGSYQVHGRLSALIEVGAGFHGDLTGRENIHLSGSILGMTRAAIRAKEEQIIEFAGVPEAIDTPVKRYSSGMLARLGFAVAAHMDPQILLVDEVLSVGDARFRDRCIRHMHGLLRSGITVVFISHILPQVRSLCPRTLVLDAGQVAYAGPTEGAIRAYLDLLSDPTAPDADSDRVVSVRDVRFLCQNGLEPLQWQARRPGVIELDLQVARPVGRLTILISFTMVGGAYLGTASSLRQGLMVPPTPGRHRVRFTLQPMPLADGEYAVEINVRDVDADRSLWASPQPCTLSVRGADLCGPPLLCDGRWELCESVTAEPGHLADPQALAVDGEGP